MNNNVQIGFIRSFSKFCLLIPFYDFPHAINCSKHLGLHELRGGATNFIPSASVGYEQ